MTTLPRIWRRALAKCIDKRSRRVYFIYVFDNKYLHSMVCFRNLLPVRSSSGRPLQARGRARHSQSGIIYRLIKLQELDKLDSDGLWSCSCIFDRPILHKTDGCGRRICRRNMQSMATPLKICRSGVVPEIIFKDRFSNHCSSKDSRCFKN